MKNRSFQRAVYEGSIRGPLGLPLPTDVNGRTIRPNYETVSVSYPLGDGRPDIIADFKREIKLEVVSVAGTIVGRITDFQITPQKPEPEAVTPSKQQHVRLSPFILG